MKNSLKALLIVCVHALLILGGCSFFQKVPFQFSEPVDSITKIDIVYAKNANDFTTLYSIPEDKTESFLEDLLNIPFSKYIGDPVGAYSGCVRIVYSSGNYDITHGYGGEYVKVSDDNTTYYHKTICNKEFMRSLIEKYAGNECLTVSRYPFSEDPSEIQRIEVIDYMDYSSQRLSFSIDCSISKESFPEFFKNLDELGFQYDMFGEGTIKSGKAILMVYQSGYCELVCHGGVCYISVVADGYIVYKQRKNYICDKERFAELINKWVVE